MSIHKINQIRYQIQQEVEGCKSPQCPKYMRGDVVYIAKNLGASMSHFPKAQIAIVMGADDDGDGEESYEHEVKLLRDGNEVCWYREKQLTFLYRGSARLISLLNKLASALSSERQKKEKEVGVCHV